MFGVYYDKPDTRCQAGLKPFRLFDFVFLFSPVADDIHHMLYWEQYPMTVIYLFTDRIIL